MADEREICSIEWNCKNLGQLIFVQAVVLPRIMDVLCEYANDLAELGGAEC